MWSSCQSPLQQAHSHFVELLVDVLVILIVLAQLGDQSAVRQREELRVLGRGKRGLEQAEKKADSTAASASSAASGGLERGNRNLLSQRSLLLNRRGLGSCFGEATGLFGKRNALSPRDNRALLFSPSLHTQHFHQHGPDLT